MSHPDHNFGHEQGAGEQSSDLLREQAAEVILTPEQTHRLVKSTFEGLPFADGQTLVVGKRSAGKTNFSNEGPKVFTPSLGDRPLLDRLTEDGDVRRRGVLHFAVGSALTITRRANRGTAEQPQTKGHLEARNDITQQITACVLDIEGVDEVATTKLVADVARFTEESDPESFTASLLLRASEMVHSAVEQHGPGSS